MTPNFSKSRWPIIPVADWILKRFRNSAESISPQGLHQLMSEQAVTVIDVNSRHSWITARVPGALNLNPLDYSDSDLPPGKESSLVFYCSNSMCRKAPKAARRARDMGYRNVKVMSAGIRGWLASRLPTGDGE